MNPNKEDLIEKAIQWIEIAEEDLTLAKHAFTLSSNVPYRLIAFHSQQCAEKYLKAFLVIKLIDFPFTHDIEKLIEIIPSDYNLSNELNEAGILTNYAVSKRYPDFYKKLTFEEAKQAVELAERVKNVISALLTNEGLKL